MAQKIVLAFAAAASLVLFGSVAQASTANITITVDENGNGSATIVTNSGTSISSVASSLAPDSGPGGLASVLTYNLSTLGVSVTAGDVLVVEPETALVGDVLRFNAPSSLLFYSRTPPVDSLAETTTPPGSFYTNQITLTEGLNGALLYAPTMNEPGFSTDAVLTYDFVSDSVATPLPTALPLFATGVGALGLLGWRRRRKAQAA